MAISDNLLVVCYVFKFPQSWELAEKWDISKRMNTHPWIESMTHKNGILTVVCTDAHHYQELCELIICLKPFNHESNNS